MAETTPRPVASVNLMAPLPAYLTLSGNSLSGPPFILSAICEHLGFRNDCRRGSVYLTTPKVARLPAVIARLETWFAAMQPSIDRWVASQRVQP